ncbi:hypothetical protein M0Q50_03520 [bacterium]|jgi:hypothetical protein|nr:hypothetical protein [bacterium]
MKIDNNIIIFCIAKNLNNDWTITKIIDVIEKEKSYYVAYKCVHKQTKRQAMYGCNIEYEYYNKTKIEIRNKKLNNI